MRAAGQRASDARQLVELKAEPLAPQSILFEDRVSQRIARRAVDSETDGMTAAIAPAPTSGAPSPSRLSGSLETSSSALMILVFAVPPQYRAEFLGWFVDEHVPLLLLETDWLRTRVIDEAVAESHVIAIHSLAHTSALTSDFRARAGETALTRQVTGSPWFTAPSRFTFSFSEGM